MLVYKIEIVIPDIVCKSNCNICIREKLNSYEIDLTDYIKGKISDSQLITYYKKRRIDVLVDKRIFLISNVCYGDDITAFLQALKPKEWEKEAIIDIITKEKKAILLEQPSSSKLLENYGIDIIQLEKEFNDTKRREILQHLPKVQGDKITKFIDNLSRIHRVEGKEGVLKEIKEKQLSFKEKTISYGFLSAMNVKGEEWKYSKMEIEFGLHLSENISQLLQSEGDTYKKILNTIVKEVG